MWWVHCRPVKKERASLHFDPRVDSLANTPSYHCFRTRNKAKLRPHGDDSHGIYDNNKFEPLRSALCTTEDDPLFPLFLAPRVFRRQEQAFTYADALETRIAPDDAARYKVLSFETNSTGSRLAAPCPPRPPAAASSAPCRAMPRRHKYR